MIAQQINLYQDRFKEKKLFLSATHLLAISVLTVLFLLVSSFWYQAQFNQAEQANQEYLEQQQQLTQQLRQLQQKLENLLADKHIEQEINQVSRDITVRNRMIDFVARNQFGAGEGFSGNLKELSGFRVENVWLNEISLSEKDMKLSGSALQAENVPEYFNQFQQRDLFSGRVFDVFELNRQQKQDWKVDFLIASRALVDE